MGRHCFDAETARRIRQPPFELHEPGTVFARFRLGNERCFLACGLDNPTSPATWIPDGSGKLLEAPVGLDIESEFVLGPNMGG
jgi:hypothetical protein